MLPERVAIKGIFGGFVRCSERVAKGIQLKDTLAQVNGCSLAAYVAWFCVRRKTQEETTGNSNHGLREE